MEKYLYVLKIKNQAFVIMENGALKYYEDNEESYLENLEKYLKDKVKFKYVDVVKEKEIQYYDETYIVKCLNVNGFEEFIDREHLKEIKSIKKETLEYRDIKLLNALSIYELNISNTKNIFVTNCERKTTINSAILALIIALLTSIFYMTGNKINYLGISYPIIEALITFSGIYIIGKKEKKNNLGIYFIIVAILLSTTYSIYTNMIFKVINFILIPIVMASGLYLINYDNEKFDYLNFCYNIIPNITINIFNNSPLSILKIILSWSHLKDKKSSKVKEIQKGILISIPLLIVLIALLCSADPFFGSIFKNIGANIEMLLYGIKIDGIIAKIITAIIVFIVVFCFFGRLKLKELNKIKEIERYLDNNMVNTVLIMVNILYSFFTLVQLKCLYTRYSGNLSAEMYSDYAREGFFQLVIVVIINIFIILISENRVKINKLTKILNTIMTGISMSMTVSSMYKMSLYINKYGLTRLRFMTSIFMIFILVSLIFIAVFLWYNINLFKYVILTGSILYLFINFVNMDKCIATYNLNNMQGEIDVEYLAELSKDSMDVMEKAYNEGKIESKTYHNYKMKNKNSREYKWFEYNYYNNKNLL